MGVCRLAFGRRISRDALGADLRADRCVIDTLLVFLRLAGAGLILLALLHVPIGRHLKWREDVARLTPVNASIFYVHSFFICLVLVMMGAPCVLDPAIFLERSRAGTWMTWSYAIFWGIRLYFQWFVYKADLWRGKRKETGLHWWFTFVWLGLTILFAICGGVQMGWL
jgi:hypothetical protein